jgi:WD40 repeat protein
LPQVITSGQSLRAGLAIGVFVFWIGEADPLVAAPAEADRPQLVVQTGHTAINLNSVAVSAEGAWLATSGSDGSIKIWDVAARREVRTLRGDAEQMEVVALSLDGKYVAGGDSNGNVSVWSVLADLPVQQVASDKDFSALTFSPDGNWLAWCGRGGMVLWDRRARAAPRVLSRFEHGALAVAFSADGSLVATSGANGELDVWEVSSGKRKDGPRRYSAALRSLAFNGEGTALAAGGADGAILVWPLGGGHYKELAHPGGPEVRALGYLSAGTLASAAVGSLAKLVRIEIHEVDSGRVTGSFDRAIQIPPFMSEMMGRYPIAISPGGREVAYSQEFRTIELADTEQRVPERIFSGITASVSAVAISGSEDSLASATGKNIQLWNLHSGMESQIRSNFKQRIRSLAFSADGSSITAVSDANEVAVWNLAGKRLAALQGHADYVFGDGEWIGAGSYDGGISLWRANVAAAAPSARLTIGGDRTRSVSAMAITDDLKWVATANPLFGQILVWHSGSSTPLYTLNQSGYTRFSDLRFSPNGKTLAWGTWTGHIKMLDLESGSTLDLCCHRTRWVSGLGYSSDGLRLASGGQDRTIRIWDTSNPSATLKRDIAVLRGHGDGVTGVAFARAGSALISGSLDGTTRVWSVTRATDSLRLVALDDQHEWLAVAPNGLFDGTASAISHVSWRIPASNDVVGLDTFYNDYFHPGLAQAIFQGGSPQPCADIAARLQLAGLRTLERLKLVHLENGGAKERLCLPDRPAPELFSQLEVSRNGHAVALSPGNFAFLDRPGCNYAVELPGTAKDYEINGKGRLAPDTVCSARTGERGPVRLDTGHKGVLHVQTVAIGDYPEESGFESLPAVKKYASEFEAYFRHKAPRASEAYASVHVWGGVYDRDATAAHIRQRLAEIAASAQESDVVVLLLSGHGRLLPGQEMFYFVPADAREADLIGTGFNVAMLVDFLRSLPAHRSLVIINACQSGGALDSLASVADLALAGISRHVFAATTPVQYALINGGTDLFGDAINTALGARGALTHDVSVHGLVSAVTKSTTERAGSLAAGQLPVAYLRGADFIVVGKAP